MKIDMKSCRQRHANLAAQMDQMDQKVEVAKQPRRKTDLTLFTEEELKWSEHEHQIEVWQRKGAELPDL